MDAAAAAPVTIDVARDVNAIPSNATVVLVEPLYGVPAVALALDAGWGSVEVAPAARSAGPIPLVSFEQPVPAANRSSRCRVRSDDLAAVAGELGDRGALLGAPLLARPLAAQLAASSPEAITFVPVPLATASQVDTVGADRTCADAVWASGMLIRVLLEELDDRPSTLTDGAGIAVTVAQGAEDAATLLGSGLRWRAHLERGGHADDLRAASAVDMVGVVPRITIEDGVAVARVWSSTP